MISMIPSLLQKMQLHLLPETNFDVPRYPASPCACTVGITTRRCTRDLHPLHEPRSWESLSKIDPWDSCIVNYDCT